MKKLIVPVALSVLSLTAYSQAWMKGGNNPSGSPFSLGSNTNDPINFITNGFNRMLIYNGGNAFSDGSIAIGNNLPNTFTPTARFHIHQDGRPEYIRFTNNSTGTTATSGFAIGFETTFGQVGFKQYQNQPITWHLPNSGGAITEYMRMVNGTGFIGVHTNAPTRTLDVNGKLRVQDLGLNGSYSGVIMHASDGTAQSEPVTGNLDEVLLGTGSFGSITATGAIVASNNGVKGSL